jgi:hypothetical protein
MDIIFAGYGAVPGNDVSIHLVRLATPEGTLREILDLLVLSG